MNELLLIPLAVSALWVWELCVRIVAVDRSKRLGRPKPEFMDGLSLRLAHVVVEPDYIATVAVRLLKASFPFLCGAAGLFWTVVMVAMLARDIGLVGAIASGVVVYGGVAVPLILTGQRVSPRASGR